MSLSIALASSVTTEPSVFTVPVVASLVWVVGCWITSLGCDGVDPDVDANEDVVDDAAVVVTVVTTVMTEVVKLAALNVTAAAAGDCSLSLSSTIDSEIVEVTLSDDAVVVVGNVKLTVFISGVPGALVVEDCPSDENEVDWFTSDEDEVDFPAVDLILCGILDFSPGAAEAENEPDRCVGAEDEAAVSEVENESEPVLSLLLESC